jgi:hypothetical protein
MLEPLVSSTKRRERIPKRYQIGGQSISVCHTSTLISCFDLYSLYINRPLRCKRHVKCSAARLSVIQDHPVTICPFGKSSGEVNGIRNANMEM